MAYCGNAYYGKAGTDLLGLYPQYLQGESLAEFLVRVFEAVVPSSIFGE